MDVNVPKDRMMKYPYTWTAKLQMFPYKYYWKHAWMTKYWVIGLFCTMPIYWKIQRMVNSPENVEKWREIRRKEFSGESH